VLDISWFPANPNVAVVAEIDLPEAVGCTAALQAGETCQHRASITMSPGEKNAIILGPRGVVVVPMPANLSGLLGARRAKAQAAGARSAHITTPVVPMAPTVRR
jgi:hypothetical protein